MSKLRDKDIRKVIQLFDNELLRITQASKIDKMKMRKKIVNVVQPALQLTTMNPEVFILEVEKKLSTILSQFSDNYGFNNRLTGVIRKLYQKAEESSTPSHPQEDR
jgi:hypothetical protein